jgi:DNA-directed RNA polymerase specialized sigma24 family protein
MQEGLLLLLESEGSFTERVREPRALARVIVRRRLISRFVPRTGGPPRPGAAPRNPRKPRVFVPLPWADADGDDNIEREQRDDATHPALTVASPEDRVIARVTIAALRADPDPWMPIPAATGRPRKRAA